VIGLFSSLAHGTSVAPPARELRGLTFVELGTYSYCGYDDFQRALEVIQPQAEQKLREAGIRVERESDDTDPTAPRLQIDVQCASAAVAKDGPLSISAGPDAPETARQIRGYVFLVRVRLFQRSVLARDPKIVVDAATFSRDGWMTAESRTRPFVELRREVLRAVDEFIGFWRDAQTRNAETD